MAEVFFPTPVGGNITDDDVAPCIVFIALYGLLMPVIVWNFIKRHQWNTIMIGTIIFAVERIVVFSLRLRQAKELSSRTSHGLLVYQQLTLANAYLGLPGDLIAVFRCVLVKPTLPDTEAGIPNQKRKRFWYRRWADLFQFIFFAAIIPGIIAGGKYAKALGDQAVADEVKQGRVAATIIGLVLMIVALLCIIYFTFTVPRIERRKCWNFVALFLALIVISIYRVTILNRTTTSLLDEGPNSLTSPGEKAAFYILQNVPEFLIVATILGGPTRSYYGTTRWGDQANDYYLNKRLKEEEEAAAQDGQTQRSGTPLRQINSRG